MTRTDAADGVTCREGGEVAALARAVQTNCHIADARHATDLSLCIYLLQMREFYRWEHGLAFDATLNRDAKELAAGVEVELREIEVAFGEAWVEGDRQTERRLLCVLSPGLLVELAEVRVGQLREVVGAVEHPPAHRVAVLGRVAADVAEGVRAVEPEITAEELGSIVPDGAIPE